MPVDRSRAPRDDDARRLLASAHFSLALGLGASPEALRAWDAAGSIFEELLREKPDDDDRRRNVALVNKYTGGWYSGQQQHDRAESRYRRAMELDERTLAAHPSDRGAQFDVAIDLANVATALAMRNVREDALRLFERSVAMREARMKSDPDDVQAQVTLARALEMTGGWRLKFDDLPGARRDAERAIEILEGLTAKNNDASPRQLLERARRIRAYALGQAPRPAAPAAASSQRPGPAAR